MLAVLLVAAKRKTGGGKRGTLFWFFLYFLLLPPAFCLLLFLLTYCSLCLFCLSFSLFFLSRLHPPPPRFGSSSGFYSQRTQAFRGNGRRASRWRGMSAAKRAP